MFVSFSQLGSYGRLGNQMFQYALIKSVANKLSCQFKIPHTECDLWKLNIQKNLLSEIPTKTYEEKEFKYDENVFNINQSVDFLGYFQSYKYFDKDLISNDFTANVDTSKITKLKKDTVSVHVRLTDYLKYPQVHPFPGLEYYKKAMSLFSDCVYVVFSDDISSCRRMFCNCKNVIFENNDTITDLFLMSACTHNIIANSSYSWWAAYLNKDNRVIYPKRWFGPKGPSYWCDLIPPSWEGI